MTILCRHRGLLLAVASGVLLLLAAPLATAQVPVVTVESVQTYQSGAYTWSVTKSVQPSTLAVPVGSASSLGAQSATYTVTVTKTASGGLASAVSGNVRITYSSVIESTTLALSSVTVSVGGGAAVTAACPLTTLTNGANILCPWNATSYSGPTSGVVIATATTANGTVASPGVPFAFGDATIKAITGDCAMVTDVFQSGSSIADAVGNQAARIPAGSPVVLSAAPTRTCASTTYTYRAQWTGVDPGLCEQLQQNPIPNSGVVGGTGVGLRRLQQQQVEQQQQQAQRQHHHHRHWHHWDLEGATDSPSSSSSSSRSWLPGWLLRHCPRSWHSQQQQPQQQQQQAQLAWQSAAQGVDATSASSSKAVAVSRRMLLGRRELQQFVNTGTTFGTGSLLPLSVRVTNLATVTPENSLQGPVTTTAAIQLVLSGCLLTPVQLQLTNLKTWAVGQVAWTLTASGSPANLIVDKQSSSGGGGSAQITLTAQPSVVGTATAWLSGTLQVYNPSTSLPLSPTSITIQAGGGLNAPISCPAIGPAGTVQCLFNVSLPLVAQVNLASGTISTSGTATATMTLAGNGRQFISPSVAYADNSGGTYILGRCGTLSIDNVPPITDAKGVTVNPAFGGTVPQGTSICAGSATTSYQLTMQASTFSPLACAAYTAASTATLTPDNGSPQSTPVTVNAVVQNCPLPPSPPSTDTVLANNAATPVLSLVVTPSGSSSWSWAVNHTTGTPKVSAVAGGSGFDLDYTTVFTRTTTSASWVLTGRLLVTAPDALKTPIGISSLRVTLGPLNAPLRTLTPSCRLWPSLPAMLQPTSTVECGFREVFADKPNITTASASVTTLGNKVESTGAVQFSFDSVNSDTIAGACVTPAVFWATSATFGTPAGSVANTIAPASVQGTWPGVKGGNQTICDTTTYKYSARFGALPASTPCDVYTVTSTASASNTGDVPDPLEASASTALTVTGCGSGTTDPAAATAASAQPAAGAATVVPALSVSKPAQVVASTNPDVAAVPSSAAGATPGTAAAATKPNPAVLQSAGGFPTAPAGAPGTSPLSLTIGSVASAPVKACAWSVGAVPAWPQLQVAPGASSKVSYTLTFNKVCADASQVTGVVTVRNAGDAAVTVRKVEVAPGLPIVGAVVVSCGEGELKVEPGASIRCSFSYASSSQATGALLSATAIGGDGVTSSATLDYNVGGSSNSGSGSSSSSATPPVVGECAEATYGQLFDELGNGKDITYDAPGGLNVVAPKPVTEQVCEPKTVTVSGTITAPTTKDCTLGMKVWAAGQVVVKGQPPASNGASTVVKLTGC